MRYKNVCRSFFPFVTIHAFDGRTDWRTVFSWPYRALHYMRSHGKNQCFVELNGKLAMSRKAGHCAVHYTAAK